jgi:hypothetical protein
MLLCEALKKILDKKEIRHRGTCKTAVDYVFA